MINATLRLQNEFCDACGCQLARVFDNDAKDYLSDAECMSCTRQALAESEAHIADMAHTLSENDANIAAVLAAKAQADARVAAWEAAIDDARRERDDDVLSLIDAPYARNVVATRLATLRAGWHHHRAVAKEGK